jgi:hypothetical protein
MSPEAGAPHRSLWTDPRFIVPVYVLGAAFGLTMLSFTSQRADDDDACRRLGGRMEHRGCMLPMVDGKRSSSVK